jgi:hypothetical protein
VKVILAAALNDLRVHSHEIAAAHQQRFFNAVKLRRGVFENLCFFFHGSLAPLGFCSETKTRQRI